jgi:hypothetical protein
MAQPAISAGPTSNSCAIPRANSSPITRHQTLRRLVARDHREAYERSYRRAVGRAALAQMVEMGWPRWRSQKPPGALA